VLFQNDDYGKDYLKGLRDGLGAKAASMIVAEESLETSEPSIDNHIVKLKSTNAASSSTSRRRNSRRSHQENERDPVEADALLTTSRPRRAS